MLGTLALLVFFHGSLTDMMGRTGHSPMDPQSFRSLHSWYLWISTIQWAAGVAYTLLTLAAWVQTEHSPEGV
jgi:hypothetical protein